MQRVYEFGPFRLDAAESLLLKNGRPVAVTPKVFNTLVLLLENPGRLVDKAEFMSKLWPDTFVEEVTLAGNISDLRKVLGDRTNGDRYIQTVPKRGYRFVAEVAVVEPAPAGRVDPQGGPPGSGAASPRTTTSDPPSPPAVAALGRPAHWPWAALAGTAVLVLAAFGATIWTGRGPARASGSLAANSLSSPASTVSLAVLPFKSLDAAQADPVVELGLADTLIARLSNISQISVRPISAVRKYAEAASDPIAAGRELGVDGVLESTLQRQPGAGQASLRVTARLLRVGDGSAIWTGSFDQPPAQLFALEDAVASQVAAALAGRLTVGERRLLARHATESPEAYQLYLKGRFFWNQRSRDGFQKAIGYFEQAIQKDPSYALAYAGLADSHLLVGGYSYIPQREAVPRARSAVEKALALDSRLAEAHTTLALIHQNYDWDWAAAEREYKLAIQWNPNYATAHGWYGEFLVYMGRFEESFSEMQRAVQLDPLSLSLNTDTCHVFYFSRQYDKAIEQCRRVLEMDPGFTRARARLAGAYFEKRMFPEALAEAQRLKQNDDPFYLTALGSILAASGDRAGARKYQKLLNAKAAREHVPPFTRWGIALQLGDHNEALHWLEKTYEERDVGLIILKTDPALDPLRGEPRFQALLRKMNFPE